MKTRSNEPEATPGLPPPPAPPAHDANPWPMSSSEPRQDPTLPSRRRRARPSASPSAPGHRRPLGAAPLLVLIFLCAAGVRLAVHAWRDEDYAGMFAALAILSLVALMFWRRSRVRR
jgi:hypothetical protein